MSEKELTPKEELFVTSYCTDFNGSRAARDVGYSEKAAKEIAYKLLTKDHVKQAIRNHIDIVVADKNKILAENIKFWVEMRNDPETQEHARLKASEYLAKYGEMFVEKVEHNHTGGVGLKMVSIADIVKEEE